VDAGDLIQGNPFATYFARVAPAAEHPILAAMNRMGYDAAVPGNHEFNFGLPVLQRSLGAARFPYVAANLERADGAAVLPPFVVLERGGVRIAIVGATTPGTMVWDGPNVRGRVAVRGVREAVPPAVAAARRQGSDAVILVAHAGLDGPSSYPDSAAPPENDVAGAIAAAPGLDAVIIGHTHREIADTTVYGVLVAQPRNWAQSVAVVELTLVREAGPWRVVARRGRLVPLRTVRPDSALVRSVLPAHEEARAWATRPVGRSSAELSAARARLEDTPVIDLINFVQREHTGADLSATAAFDTRGRLPAGDVSRADLASIYPYDNTLTALRISGADLRAFLEHSARYYRGMGPDGPVVNDSVPGYNFDIVSGADYELDLTRPVGQRVVALSVRGRNVTATDSFTLATNNYRAAGGGGFTMTAGAPVVYDRGEDIRDLLAEWLSRRDTLRPDEVFVRNWHIRGLRAATTDGR
jgi:2',3'-cyclic-nucleotide 2'-phosphodiesterase/3'-nucleotidase